MASWSRHPGPGQRYRHGWIPIGEVGDFKRGSRGGTFQAAHRQAQRTGKPALIKGKTRDFKVESTGRVHARSARGPGKSLPASKRAQPTRKRGTRDANFGERRPGTETVGAPKTNSKNVGRNIGKPGALSKPESKRKMAPKDNVVRSQEALNKARATAKRSGKSVYVTPDFKLGGSRPKGPHVEIAPDGKKFIRRNG